MLNKLSGFFSKIAKLNHNLKSQNREFKYQGRILKSQNRETEYPKMPNF